MLRRGGMSLPYRAVRAALEGRPLRVSPRTLDGALDLVSSEDVAEAIRALLGAERLAHPAYNVAAGVLTPVRDVLGLLREHLPGVAWIVDADAHEVDVDPQAARADERVRDRAHPPRRRLGAAAHRRAARRVRALGARGTGGALPGARGGHVMAGSAALDLVIRGGTVVDRSGTYAADVGVVGERIACVGRGLRGRRELDAHGAYVLPGAIDGHVHIRTERRESVYDDTFATGSVAAAFGGVTTFIDQIQLEPGLGLTLRAASSGGSSRPRASASSTTAST